MNNKHFDANHPSHPNLPYRDDAHKQKALTWRDNSKGIGGGDYLFISANVGLMPMGHRHIEHVASADCSETGLEVARALAS